MPNLLTGKAYYFTTDTFYPNNLVGTMNEGDWRWDKHCSMDVSGIPWNDDNRSRSGILRFYQQKESCKIN